jgi:SAM-dependent methyltransferase
MNTYCPVCGSVRIKPVYQMLDVPVYCNLLETDRKDAMNCRRGDIRLVFCEDCGLIWNAAFDPSLMEYTTQYDNTLYYSKRFRDYAADLAERIVKRYELYGKDIIEVGCGSGDFLSALCDMGGNRGMGFDRSYVKRNEMEASNDKVEFISDYYSEKYSDYKADLICCRQTLEHIPEPVEFLNSLRWGVKEESGTFFFFEVPNASYTIRNVFIWDIIYEHCSYFTPLSMVNLFGKCNFHVEELAEEFGGQYLVLYSYLHGVRGGTSQAGEVKGGGDTHSHLLNSVSEKTEILSEEIDTFGKKCRNLVDHWRTRIEKIFEAGKSVIVWGAGSKGVTFLNLLGIRDNIQYIVDINPNKRGKYIPGTGQKIVGSDFLVSHPPDVIIIMNPLYKQEISAEITDLGVRSELVTI